MTKQEAVLPPMPSVGREGTAASAGVGRAAQRPPSPRGAELDRAIVLAEQAVMARDARWSARLQEVEAQLESRLARWRRVGWVAGAVTVAGAVVLGIWRQRQGLRGTSGRNPVSASSHHGAGGWWWSLAAAVQPLWRVAARTLHLPSGAAALPAVVGWLWPNVAPGPAKAPVRTTARVDIERYAGHWYEIARLPERHEAACAGDATARYELGNRWIHVVNSCRRADGRIDRAEGRAHIVAGSGGAKLRVSFAPAWLRWLPLAWGDYWILWLDLEYTAALVGTPDRAHLWLLARAPVLEETLYRRMLDCARDQGFDLAALTKTPQSSAALRL